MSTMPFFRPSAPCASSLGRRAPSEPIGNGEQQPEVRVLGLLLCSPRDECALLLEFLVVHLAAGAAWSGGEHRIGAEPDLAVMRHRWRGRARVLRGLLCQGFC